MLFANVLYVETNFELSVKSFVVIPFCPVTFAELFVAKIRDVDERYFGVTNPIVYTIPITTNTAIIKIICQPNHYSLRMDYGYLGIHRFYYFFEFQIHQQGLLYSI